MFIKNKIYQHRRDFKATYKCQFCGNEKDNMGYDDANFHNNVIPAMVCEHCGKSTNSENDTSYTAMGTRYPEGYQI